MEGKKRDDEGAQEVSGEEGKGKVKLKRLKVVSFFLISG